MMELSEEIVSCIPSRQIPITFRSSGSNFSLAHQNFIHKTMKQLNLQFKIENRWFLGLTLATLIAGTFIIAAFLRSTNYSTLLRGGARRGAAVGRRATSLQMSAIVHYATASDVPQQSRREINVTFDVLRSLGPSNFLVFGLGLDSLMWAALNDRGKTLFLEEDPEWVKTVLKDAPMLRAKTVRYRTRLSEADELMRHSRTEPACSPENAFLRGNEKCRLALNTLPNEVYDTEWDLIMVDAPRGWFPEAPGRMAAIYSAAVMARNRKTPGVTHVFLHDVDRKVEKMYAEAFLCKNHLVKGVDRLWHFAIPPIANMSSDFC